MNINFPVRSLSNLNLSIRCVLINKLPKHRLYTFNKNQIDNVKDSEDIISVDNNAEQSFSDVNVENTSNEKKESRVTFEKYIIKGLNKETKPHLNLSPKFSVVAHEAWLEPYKYNWEDFWPTADSFSSSYVPLPLRQGTSKNHLENGGIPRDKLANMELIKLVNFLHLTPKHIERQCAALRHLCTEWPSQLDTEEKMQQHFPVEVIKKDFVFSAKSLRDPRARVVTIRLPLGVLNLDEHARNKFVRLVGPDCYDSKTDMLELTADRCPSKQQNYDYLHYLLRALCHESRRTEAWEVDIEEEDWSTFQWDKSTSRKTLLQILKREGLSRGDDADKRCDLETELLLLPQVKKYAEAVTALYNKSEDAASLQQYKDAVTSLLFDKTQMSKENDDQCRTNAP